MLTSFFYLWILIYWVFIEVHVHHKKTYTAFGPKRLNEDLADQSGSSLQLNMKVRHRSCFGWWWSCVLDNSTSILYGKTAWNLNVVAIGDRRRKVKGIVFVLHLYWNKNANEQKWVSLTIRHLTPQLTNSTICRIWHLTPQLTNSTICRTLLLDTNSQGS